MGDALPAVDLGLGLTARSVAVGHSRSCAVLDSGSLKCWGYNRTGLLGLGDKEFRGDEPDEMGDALPDIDLGESSRATLVSVGSSHTCALLESGLVKCWGNASLGELGLGDQEQRGDEPGEMGEALPPVDLGRGERARTLSAGGDHTCAVLENDSLKCWGNSFLGQVGLGDTVVHGDEPGEMGDALPTVDLGVGLSVRSVSAGRSHSCALLHDGTMKCWGSNEYGQLGLGDRENRGDEPGEMGDALPTVDLAF
jgi:alpha-tubulin suppressor-like RCC1 family protein